MVHRASWSWSWDLEGGGETCGHRAEGCARRSLVDRAAGAVHTDLALCRLAAGGRLDAHAHSYERCVYVLGGRPVLELDGKMHQLETGRFALFPVGVVHAWRNAGSGRVRWIETQAPQAPRRRSYRWPAHWRRLAGQLGAAEDL